MAKALSALEKLLVVAWLAAGLAACWLAAHEIREVLHSAGATLPIAAMATAAFVVALLAVALLSVALSFRLLFLEKLGACIAALFGDSHARGRIELWAAQERVWKEWRRHQGLHDAESTAESVYEFVRDSYGVDLSRAVKSRGFLPTAKLRRLVNGITALLLRYGRFKSAQAETPDVPDGPPADADPTGRSSHPHEAGAELVEDTYSFHSVEAGPRDYSHRENLDRTVVMTGHELVASDHVPRVKQTPQWVQQAPALGDGEVIEFDIPTPTHERRAKPAPSVEDILARVLETPEAQPKKAPEAHVESGAMIKRLTARDLHFVHRCEPCGFIEGVVRKTRTPGPRTKFASSFRCPKCRNVQKVVISGEI